MTVSVWFRAEGKKPEVVDRFGSREEAGRMATEYAMAFGCLYGQHRYGKDKVWAGRLNEEPKEERR